MHILPIGDLREHDETRDCWCRPKLQCVERTIIVIHNSADGRELIEEHGVQ
jgi:hypothetical protein